MIWEILEVVLQAQRDVNLLTMRVRVTALHGTVYMEPVLEHIILPSASAIQGTLEYVVIKVNLHIVFVILNN